MNRPEGIPEDIWAVATDAALSEKKSGEMFSTNYVLPIARAILAERTRCAKPVEDAIHEYWHGKPHDLSAGDLTKILTAIRGVSK